MVESITNKIKSIKFSLLSPSEIKKMSVAKIVTPELYDREGYPVDGGLMDIRLGVIDPGLRCKTCGQKLRECIGHFGHVDFARPVIHISFIDKVLAFLRTSCKDCGRVLATEEKIRKQYDELERVSKEKTVKDREIAIRKFVNSLKLITKCPHCNVKQEKVTIDKPTTIFGDGKRLSPIEIRSRLEKINDEDLELYGINAKSARPEWMVLTILPVSPVTIRPSITLQSGERSEDDITHKVGDIVRINQRLFENINAGAPEVIIEDLWDLLQYHVTTLFNNAVTQVPVARHRSGQPLKTLTQRIKSKEGRFRHNLAGKRVNYSSRAVISPDPKIKFNEVGIPQSVAMTLTVPEQVTEWNLDWLKKLVENGPTKYPGANYVISPDGKKKKVTVESIELLLEELEQGYVVERHLLDGDISIFNRQPSLHRMSIMGHIIKLLPGKSFRLNPSVCSPYGADFDGDEMNLHIPQTPEARAEAMILLNVENNIISPKNGFNVVGSIADAITGNYLLTKKIKLPKDEAIHLLVSIGIYDSEKFSGFGDEVSGKEIFSTLLPDDLNFVGYSKEYSEDNPDDAYVVKIKDGKLIGGIIDKATIGEDNGSLVRTIYSKYDNSVALNIINNMSKLGLMVLLRHGFTTSISDTDLPEKIRNRNTVLLKAANSEVEKLIKDFYAGKIEAIPGNSVEDTLELKIVEILNKVRNKIGKQVSDSIKENSTVIMANSGAQGNFLNIAQMSACVGQQSMKGKRVVGGYDGRTLSVFNKGDLSPSSRGFIQQGYRQGMSPTEYFFGAMTGRDGLMDTALRTPKSGYLYRRLANALQDIKVEYDNTVRDAYGNIIQFKYGEDGIDISKSDGGTINVNKIIKEIRGK
ncbi:DNA-directed RNA polymerase subunit A' [archaeon]|nr:DNA-directed RNA polymerase subunit A' [archaeon]MBT7297314.1 DNA-directed RNA polymerase subunit A' [archaeon]